MRITLVTVPEDLPASQPRGPTGRTRWLRQGTRGGGRREAVTEGPSRGGVAPVWVGRVPSEGSISVGAWTICGFWWGLPADHSRRRFASSGLFLGVIAGQGAIAGIVPGGEAEARRLEIFRADCGEGLGMSGGDCVS